MNKIEITVLSARVLDALSVRGLKAKTVREFERYGTRRIVQHCLDNGQTIYFKETVQDFVWQERARMESGALPHYQWVLTRRAAVYLDQMAKHGKFQGEPLRSWEAEHNPLFQNAPHGPSNSMKVIDIICRTRDAVIQLELSDKTKTNYIYCGFGPILNFFASRGEEFYSPETLALFVNKAKENYANGTIPKASFQTMRKAARWIEECLSTGRVSQRKLRKYNFACAPPEFEKLLSQYQIHMDNENYLKEGTRQFYLSSVRTFFRTMTTATGQGGANTGPSVIEKIIRWIVRRLTPTECERLQGYPDGWTDLGDWVDSKGKAHKAADTPRYKALGNSIALPQWYYVLGGIADRLPEDATLGSLFDGIGGFPYVWAQLHAGRKQLCVWASEIEEFPIAVTKKWFPEVEDGKLF